MPQGDLERLGRIAAETPMPSLPTGFVENFSAELERAIFTNTTVARDAALAEAYDDYLDQVQQETGEYFPNPIAQTPVQSGRFGMAQARKQLEQRLYDNLKERGFAAVPPDELRNRADQIQIESERRAQEVAETRTTAGALGGFAGGITGAFADPPVVASMFIGAPLASGVLKTAALEAVIGGATEAVLQPVIQAERERLGLEAGLDVALENVAFAAAGGAVFGGGLKALMNLGAAGRGALQRVRNRITGPDAPAINRDSDALLARVDQVERASPFESSPRGLQEHLRHFDPELQRLQTGSRKQQLAVNPGVPVRQVLGDPPRLDFEPEVNAREVNARAAEVQGVAAKLIRELDEIPAERLPEPERPTSQPRPRTVEEETSAVIEADRALEADVRSSIEQDEAFGGTSVRVESPELDEVTFRESTVADAIQEVDDDLAAVAEFEGCVG